MLKMAILFNLLAPLFFLCSFVLGQESLQILTLHRYDSSSVAPLQAIGISMDEEKLNEVSNSILLAEKWLRIHVLSRYPSRNIKFIVVSNGLLCNEEGIKNREEIVRLTVDSMKNIYYSLTRWGLERDIKVSVSLSLSCLHESHLKNVYSFLEKINSTFTINTPQFSDEIVGLLISELKTMNDFGVFQTETMNVIFPVLNQAKFTSRKLSFMDYMWSAPTPPSPVVEFSPAPEIQSPLISPASSPSPHNGFNFPPCNPYPHGYHAPPPVVSNGDGSMAVPPMVSNGNGGGSMAAPPTTGREERLWCVAKPSVPSEKLQEAMDYACGAGGADCGPIKPNGSCYSPDSVVAHASYAFNSYWQKKKKNGGVCGFDGTAMLISSDPSFLHCHFTIG